MSGSSSTIRTAKQWPGVFPAARARSEPRRWRSAMARTWGTVKLTVAVIVIPSATQSSSTSKAAAVAGSLTAIFGAQAWYRYRHAALDSFSLAHLAEIVADLPAFLSNGTLKDEDLIPVDRIATVAVWDTVGAMGVPMYAGGKLRDAFKFADMKLSTKVTNGFHAVALDEQRKDFTPTLWEAAANVIQVLFPGAHADVGGGYPTANNESGLSDGALKWMIGQLTGAGVLFSDSPQYQIKPDPAGTAHKPWTHKPWTLPGVQLGPRTFPAGMQVDPSIAARKGAGDVVAEPGKIAGPYDPGNLP